MSGQTKNKKTKKRLKMITKETADWLARYTERYPIEEVENCANCGCGAKLEVRSDGLYGIARFVCANGCGMKTKTESIDDDAEMLIAKARKEWNIEMRSALRQSRKSYAKKK